MLDEEKDGVVDVNPMRGVMRWTGQCYVMRQKGVIHTEERWGPGNVYVKKPTKKTEEYIG